MQLNSHCNVDESYERPLIKKGPVKLIQWVKIALLFLHVISKPFQFTILNMSG